MPVGNFVGGVSEMGFNKTNVTDYATFDPEFSFLKFWQL